MSTPHLFSLEGRALKLDTLASIEPYLNELHAVEQLDELRLDGNTLGVEACAGVGDALSTKQSLRVSITGAIRKSAAR